MNEMSGQAPLAKDGMNNQVPHPEVQDVMRQIAPLLVGGCLTHSERLGMFRSSKATADMVLQHAPCIELTLSARKDSTASSSQRATAMQLASQAAPRVMLNMRQGLVTPPEPLWQRLTTLTLSDLSYDSFSLWYDSFKPLLRLTTPKHLHTLRLERCTFYQVEDSHTGNGGSSSSSGSGAGGGKGTSNSSGISGTSGSTATGLSVRTLQCVACKPDLLEHSYLRSVLALLDKSQLQELSTDATHDVSVYLFVLPQLQQLHMPHVIARNSSMAFWVCHNNLKRVSVGAVKLKDDFSATQPVSLQEMHFTGYTDLVTLAALPLAKLRCCSLGQKVFDCCGGTRDPAVLNDALSKVALHQDKVVHQASSPYDAPQFELHLAPHYSASQVQQLISMVTRNLCGELIIDSPPATTLAALAAALPETVTAITFNYDISGLLQLPGSFINLLPDHVGSVTLYDPSSTSTTPIHLQHVQQILTGVTRPVKLVFTTLAVHGLGGWLGATRKEQLATLKGRIREVLASYPNQVEVKVKKLRRQQ